MATNLALQSFAGSKKGAMLQIRCGGDCTDNTNKEIGNTSATRIASPPGEGASQGLDRASQVGYFGRFASAGH